MAIGVMTDIGIAIVTHGKEGRDNQAEMNS
jgi:hypothetical protein